MAMASESHLNISLPERRFAVLGVPVVVENTHGLTLSVIPLDWVPVMDGSVDGPASQGRNAHGDSDDRHGW